MSQNINQIIEGLAGRLRLPEKGELCNPCEFDGKAAAAEIIVDNVPLKTGRRTDIALCKPHSSAFLECTLTAPPLRASVSCPGCLRHAQAGGAAGTHCAKHMRRRFKIEPHFIYEGEAGRDCWLCDRNTSHKKYGDPDTGDLYWQCADCGRVV